jgi:hypothetical protein
MLDRANPASRLVLPLAWAEIEGAPTSEMRAAAEWSNAGIVRFLLHEIEAGAAVRPAEERLAEALAPVHARLEMIVEMLGRLSYRDLAVPPRRAIDLSLERLVWLAPRAVAVGGWLRLQLYFHTVFLEPVVLYGKVEACRPAADGEGSDVQAELAEIPEATGEALIRLAFLTQRRQRGERSGSHPARVIP